MAVVLGVIKLSILLTSKLPCTGSMSQKTGFMLFQCSACVVATKEQGVVITSPLILNACKAVIRPNVALENKEIYLTPKYYLAIPLKPP